MYSARNAGKPRDFYLLLHDGMLDTLVTEVTLPVFLYHYDGPIYIQYLCTVEAYR
jgi:hypothetical protein